VKVELLRDNPHRITNVSRWPEIIGNKWLSTDVIENHLQRIRNSESTLIRPYPAASAIITEDKIELRQIVCGQGFGKRKRLVLFAHYDPHSIIDPHVIASINGFNLANCDVVFITSTHSQVEISKVINLCAAVIIKSPGGRDFGSWQIAIQSIKREFFAYDSIVWVNDSIYYPLFDPNEMFDVMEKRNLDFWGVTDSETIRHHIMSWFWSFNKKIINDGWFDWFENNNNTSYTKWAQIRNLETRIPGSFNRNGYKIGSFITASDIKQYFDRSLVKDPRFSGRTDFTMTHIFWDLIIKEFRCPALKVELLRDNPLGIDISKLQEFVEINTDYNASLIEGHLRRINRYDPIALVGH
jgi:lipopolysaccharide biosynthesis protein